MFADRLHAVRRSDRLSRPLLAVSTDDRTRLDLRPRTPGRRAPTEGHRRDQRHPPRLPLGPGEHSDLDRADRNAAVRDRARLARCAALGRNRDDGVDSPRARGGHEGRPRATRRPGEARRLRPRRGRRHPRDRHRGHLSAFGAFFSELVDRFTEWAGIATPSGLLLRDGVQLARDRDHRPAPLPLRPGTPDPPPRSPCRGDPDRGRRLGATKVLAIVFSDFSRYNLIYGSLAGVMTFLFFVYVVAFILLLGAEFAYAWSQPPGPPGPPLRTQVIGVVTRPLRPPRRRREAG